MLQQHVTLCYKTAVTVTKRELLYDPAYTGIPIVKIVNIFSKQLFLCITSFPRSLRFLITGVNTMFIHLRTNLTFTN